MLIFSCCCAIVCLIRSLALRVKRLRSRMGNSPHSQKESSKRHLPNISNQTPQTKPSERAHSNRRKVIRDLPVHTISISNEDIAGVVAQVHEADQYKLQQRIPRNVLLVGRSRSGKSTLLEVLKDVTYCPPQLSLFSETRAPASHLLPIETPGDEENPPQKYTINVVDTPGLYEVIDVEGKARTNSSLLGMIRKCLRQEVSAVHCMIILVTVSAGIFSEDLSSIEILLRSFSLNTQLTTVLCISRAENFTLQDKDHFRKELCASSLGPLLEQHRVLIRFSGCVCPSSPQYASKDQLLLAYKKVYTMRKELLEIIFGCETPVYIASLPAMDEFVELAQAALRFLEYCSSRKRNLREDALTMPLRNHQRRMAELACLGPELLVGDERLGPVMKRVEAVLVKLRVQYGEEVREVSRPWIIPAEANRPNEPPAHFNSPSSCPQNEPRRSLRKRHDAVL